MSVWGGGDKSREWRVNLTSDKVMISGDLMLCLGISKCRGWFLETSASVSFFLSFFLSFLFFGFNTTSPPPLVDVDLI